MGDYTLRVKEILKAHGCTFLRYGKGDHERWYSPITNANFSIDGKIESCISANKQLKDAGIRQKV
ncbi:MAG: type II toxin-antitoxin system HicA family toxin [Clostridiales bacterium]|jgi:uncharacterized protein YifE (UPF0438 family)|nr:type II toxin-antitoxin system HicA family toxin [Clostridiales bacterium]